MSIHHVIRPGLLAASLIAVAACRMQPAAEAPKAAALPTTQEAAAIVDGAEASWASGDTAKIMAAYREGGTWFDPVAVAPSADRSVQTKWTDGFTAMKLTDMTIANKTVQVLDDDTIVASGIATFSNAAQGDPVTFRYTDVYQKEPDGKWMIVHEHLSATPAETAAAVGAAAAPAAENAAVPAG